MKNCCLFNIQLLMFSLVSQEAVERLWLLRILFRSTPCRSTYLFFRQVDPANRRVGFPRDFAFFILFRLVINQSLLYSSINFRQVEMTGLEPVTSALQRRRSPS